MRIFDFFTLCSFEELSFKKLEVRFESSQEWHEIPSLLLEPLLSSEILNIKPTTFKQQEEKVKEIGME